MPEPFDQLLDATLQHLYELKEQGLRYVAVSPETVAALLSPRANAPTLHAPTLHAPRSNTAPLHAPRSDATRTQAMAELRERALQCVKCPHLASSRKNVVFGVGSIDAEIMFVGEAP